MKMLRRFLAPLLALCFALAPAGAATLGQKAAILNGVQGWSYAGSSIDLFFSLNGGSCTINRLLKPCSSLLTTTRASTGYAQWADGHLSSFAANVPRITDLGLLVEQAATNLALWSQDFTNAAWVNYWAGPTSRTANAAVAPDGTTTATQLVLPFNAGGTQPAGITQTLASITAGNPNAVAVWLKGAVGGEVVTLCYDDTSGNGSVTLTTAWVRYKVAGTTGASGGHITIRNSSTTTNITIFAWQGQAEASTISTSDIRTTTVAVTRAADAISLAINNSRLTIGSLYTKVLWPTFNGTANIFVEGNNGASLVGATLAMTTATNYELDARNGATAGGRGSSSANAGLAAGASARLGVSWDSATAPNGSFNGAASSAFGAQSEADWAGNSLSIGSRGAGNSLFANTYIQRVTVWYNQKLSAAQLAALP